MEMNVIWSIFSRKEYIKALTYLRDEFGAKSAYELSESVDNRIKQIIDNPLSVPREPILQEEEIEYRSAIVGKYNKIIFSFNANTIFISDFWDMRKEPSQMKKRIKRK